MQTKERSYTQSGHLRDKRIEEKDIPGLSSSRVNIAGENHAKAVLGKVFLQDLGERLDVTNHGELVPRNQVNRIGPTSWPLEQLGKYYENVKE